MHTQNLATTSTVQFPIKQALRVALSEFSSKIFVTGLDGYLHTFNRKIIESTTKGRAPKIFIQRVYPDTKLPEIDEEGVLDSIISCSPTEPKAYMTFGAGVKEDKIVVFNTDTGARVKTILMDSFPVFSAFSPDGKYVYVSLLNGSLSVFSSETDEEIKRVDIGQHGGASVIRVLPDGKSAVLASTTAIRLLDLVNYKIIAETVKTIDDNEGLCISWDGKKAYLPEIMRIDIFDAKTLKKSPKELVGGFLYAGLASSPNHPYVVACSDVLEIIDTDEDKIVDRVHIFGPNVSSITDVVVDKYDITYLVTQDGLTVVRFY